MTGIVLVIAVCVPAGLAYYVGYCHGCASMLERFAGPFVRKGK